MQFFTAQPELILIPGSIHVSYVPCYTSGEFQKDFTFLSRLPGPLELE